MEKESFTKTEILAGGAGIYFDGKVLVGWECVDEESAKGVYAKIKILIDQLEKKL